MTVTLPALQEEDIKQSWRANAPKKVPPASCFTRFRFGQVSGVIRLARRRGKLELSDIAAMQESETAEASYKRFMELWAEEQKKPRPSIARSMWALVAPFMKLALVISYIGAAAQLCGPILLQKILEVLEVRQSGVCDNGSDNYMCEEWVGYAFVAGIFVSLSTAALANNHSQLLCLQAALRIRGALITAVYIKSLSLSGVGMSKTGAGFINNLSANDTEQLLQGAQILSLLPPAPVMIIVSFFLLSQLVGAAFLGGFGAMILVLLCATTVVTKIRDMKIEQMKHSDRRVKLTNEMIAGVRVVKAFGWELPFMDMVMKIRQDETWSLKKQGMTISFLGMVILASPIILAIVTISIYAVDNVLKASVVFTVIALLNIIRFPLAFLPFGIGEILKIMVSFRRLQRMMEAEESAKSVAASSDSVVEHASLEDKASVLNAEFGYPIVPDEVKGKGKGKGKGGCLGKLFGGKGKGKGKGKDKDQGKGDGKGKDEPEEEIDPSKLVEVKRPNGEVLKFKKALQLDEFELVPGGLTVIIGPVGSGKSSLLGALLGEVETISGEAQYLKCKLAYSAQVPWIMNATFEDNIKFSAPDRGEDWYHEVLDRCCLGPDIEMFPAGDQTEIGEKGINLSGGQRARVCVARAVYRDADVFLFDDPLAAVDAHVGKKLFTEVFGPEGLLAKKTRVLVTHQVHLAASADKIVVMDGGVVTATGTYQELLAKGISLDALTEPNEGQKEEVEKGEEAATKSQSLVPQLPLGKTRVNLRGSGTSTGQLTEKEGAKDGVVQMSTYKDFLVKAYGSYAVASLVLLMTISVSARLLTDLWLAEWTSKGDPWGLAVGACIAIYCVGGVSQAILTYFRSFINSSIGLINASRRIYKMLCYHVFRSPVLFFDVTPTGRILNRFTADIDIIDNAMPRAFGQTIGCFEAFLGIVIGIAIVNPVVIIAIVPVCVGYYFLSLLFRDASRDCQRLEAVTKSPIFNKISETLSGLQTVRAFEYEKTLTTAVIQDIDDNQACNLLKVEVSCWLAFRLEVLSVLITTVSALLPLLPFSVGGNAAFVGVALTYGLDLSRYVQAMAKSLTDIEQKFTSVERCFEYCELPQEADPILPADTALSTWPSGGKVEFKDVTMRYRPELEPALRRLNFSVNAGEKLGVVGRTGSGKSSIIVTLLRLTECESGHIYIDGQDVQALGLVKLRQSLAMIPQDPVLFGKTSLRDNLDPLGEHTDAEVESALNLVRMNNKELLPEGLRTEVEEGGAPFSVGQRQLLCLARAALRRSRVLLLDEATASVDGDTDAFIQQTIRETFRDSTVLCIAHRLNTILDSDKVMVMGAGACKELGPPSQLLASPNSELRALAIQSGIEVPELVDDVEV